LSDFSRFAKFLACPLDATSLSIWEEKLVCEKKHEFAIEQGVPIFTNNARREYEPRNMPACKIQEPSTTDPFVSNWIVNTNGNLYWRVRGKLPRYPIPEWPFAKGEGKVVVDLGCGWGRWCLSATAAGLRAIGVDVHLDALQAAKRVANQKKVDAGYFCSDIEHLPFRSGSIDQIFSYSVLQHLEREKVGRILEEGWRVLKAGGELSIQLPNARGLYSFVQRLRRGFREAKSGTFEMRYWSRSQIRELLRNAGFQGAKITADGYFSQNPQLTDLDLLSVIGKSVVLTSYAGCALSRAIPPLVAIADSFWITARKPENGGA